MILGADWLEEHSPMWVHWGRKIMRFTSASKKVTLLGLNQEVVQCPQVSRKVLKGLLNRQAITHCIQLRLDLTQSAQFQETVAVASISEQLEKPQVEQLLHQFADIFQTPTALPPPRPFDHRIPLLPGSQLVNVRAYRYSPTPKG